MSLNNYEHGYNGLITSSTVPNEEPEWMMPMDRRILELMAQTAAVKPGGLAWKPGHIAKNLNASRDYINHRIRDLHDHGYVKSEDGYYRITEQGITFAKS